MLKFDAIFLDTTTYKPYDQHTLETEPLGGSEASVVRVAEALGRAGLKVGVVQHNRQQLSAGRNAFYLPMSYLHDIERCDNLISFRGINGLNLFPKAKKFSWHEDLPSEKFTHWKPYLLEHNVLVIAASRWHKYAISYFLHDGNDAEHVAIKYIYNPVDDQMYIGPQEYVPNKLVWASSPHKGLKRALHLFERLKELRPEANFELHCFNPGYYGEEMNYPPGCVYKGPVSSRTLAAEMATALCVFYPTTFKETFGNIFAEANAVGCPVATYDLAALGETVSTREQRMQQGDEKYLLDSVLAWHEHGRPFVEGNPEFKTSKVVEKWLAILK